MNCQKDNLNSTEEYLHIGPSASVCCRTSGDWKAETLPEAKSPLQKSGKEDNLKVSNDSTYRNMRVMAHM